MQRYCGHPGNGDLLEQEGAVVSMEKTFRFADIQSLTIASLSDLLEEGVQVACGEPLALNSFVVLVKYRNGQQDAFRPEDGFSLMFHNK